MEQKKYWQSFGEKNQSAAYIQEVKDEFKEDYERTKQYESKGEDKMLKGTKRHVRLISRDGDEKEEEF